MQIQPRLIRLRDAPAYLGMDRNRFNREVRPALLEIRIGRQGVAFDRLEMDAWVDHYISLILGGAAHAVPGAPRSPGPYGVVQGQYGLSGTGGMPAQVGLGGQGATAGYFGVHRAGRKGKEPGG